MSTGTKSSTVVSSPWASRSSAVSVASIRLCVRMTSPMTSWRCSGAQIQGGQHLEVGAHGGQRRAQFVGGDGGEVAGRLERGPGALLLVADAGEHALDRLGDLDGLPHAAHLDLVGVGLRVDRPGLLGQQPERVDHDQRDHPAHQQRPDDHAARRSATPARCSSSMRGWVSASGAPSAIDAMPAVMVRTRYSTPLIVVLA